MLQELQGNFPTECLGDAASAKNKPLICKNEACNSSPEKKKSSVGVRMGNKKCAKCNLLVIEVQTLRTVSHYAETTFWHYNVAYWHTFHVLN